MSLKTRSREIKIGILSVATILLFIWGFNYLKGRDVLMRQISIYTVYDQVNGLVESNPVLINGVKIGQVNKISFHPDRSGRILVELIISSKVEIPANSTALLTGADLMGNREIHVLMGNSILMAGHKDTLQSSTQISLQEEVSRQMLPIKRKAEDLISQMDSVLAVVQLIFNAETRKNITQSISSIQYTVKNLESSTQKLDETIANEASRLASIMQYAESITRNLHNNNELISNIIQNMSDISDTLASEEIKKTIADAQQSIGNLNNIMEKIDQGEGSIGLLVNDKELYHNLEASSKQLELLLEDIRKNPKRYLKISVF